MKRRDWRLLSIHICNNLDVGQVVEDAKDVMGLNGNDKVFSTDGARGILPALGGTERNSGQSDLAPSTRTSGGAKNTDYDSSYADNSASIMPTTPVISKSKCSSKSLGKAWPTLYRIVMYNFQAERSDELEAKAGEAIIVIAESNWEWFVAKPIGSGSRGCGRRLGMKVLVCIVKRMNGLFEYHFMD